MVPEHGPASPAGAAPRHTVSVPFTAGGTGPAPLTWSQQYYLAELDAARPHGRSLAITRLYPLIAGTDEKEATTALRELVERYESLRSRVTRTVPPGQYVHRQGSLDVAVHEVTAPATDHDVRAAAEAVLADLARRPFDVVEEWPLRAALIGTGEGPRFLALAFSHVAVDAFALLPVGAFLVARCARADPVARTAPGCAVEALQPRELAEAEASRTPRRALRHAEQTLRRMPAAPTGAGPSATGERFRFLRRRSAALDLAVGAVAARTGESPASVLTAAVLAVDAARSGERYGVVQLISANRLRPETVDAVVPCSQPVLCCVDTRDASFAELVRRTASASLRAYGAGPCPPAALAELRATVEKERGIRLDGAPTLNYRPRATSLPLRETDAEELRRAAADAESAWVDSVMLWQSAHYLSADVDDSGMRLLLQIDTDVRPARWAEHWLADLEDLLTTYGAP
ncbi:hypothetical protein HLK59_24375 [Streptomyces sp. S3(2020)]|uniref:condensation domain-containing protein n=1 Tax=Streptomyces sp. S3(2020) TaxID=2732044 RepID=UPI0014892F00|nr:condensation domain-containing protein [Streptomyces sp. S3(2020)]NNN33438.1 hypothetical protein [Streptomyces sp. S3(2020)]